MRYIVRTDILTIDDLLKLVDKNFQRNNSLKRIKKAYDFALENHAGKTRLTKDPYIMHPLNVAYILANLNVDETTIVAALIHETINNGNATEEEIENLFGIEVKNIVSIISKINKLEATDDSDSASIYLRKVLVGMAEDVRILYVKLADRLHNMRTIWAVRKEKQKHKANETMNVLVPIAHRLGINSIKSELENICLRILKPDVYHDIEEKLNESFPDSKIILNDMRDAITNILIENDIKFEIKSRVKSVYSVYNKLNNGKKWNNIYDFLALRIILEKESDCYLAVGLIHSKFRPMPNRFKDYIAMPKENMYHSLHTTIFGADGHLFEVQLRTYEMDEFAEKGMASHWSYKEKGTKKAQNIMEQKLEIFRAVIENNRDEENDSIFAKNISGEFLSDLIYVFTPKGDVVELPKGATPIDFAYRIHSNVGSKMVGAIVNDVMVPLTYELQDNDIVTIKTSNSAKPNKDWLNIVKTSQAKNKIKAYFSKQDKAMYIERGKQYLEKELRKRKLSITETLSDENIEKILKDLKLKDLNDIYFSIGSVRYTAGYIINLTTEDKHSTQEALIEKLQDNKKNIVSNHKSEIIVAGANDIIVNFAKCCNPIKGDNIVGYITKNQGIIIHKEGCKNIENKQDRFVDVIWNESSDNLFIRKLHVKINDNKNHMMDIFTLAAKRNFTIVSIDTKESYENNLPNINYEISIKIKNIAEYNTFVKDLNNQTYITEVY